MKEKNLIDNKYVSSAEKIKQFRNYIEKKYPIKSKLLEENLNLLEKWKIQTKLQEKQKKSCDS